MSIDFGPVPFPDSAIYDYSERRYSGSAGQNTASSPSMSFAFDEKIMHTRLLELSKSQSVENDDCSTDYTDEVDSLLESQMSLPTPTPPEYNVSLAKKLIFLGLYFFLNIGLTLSNKELLVEVEAPWLLTVMHATATALGCWMLVITGRLRLTKLGVKEHLVLLAFSSLFTLNIAASNVSLSMVSVPFHQIMRSTCPIVTALIYRVILKRSYQTQTYLSMMPLIIGVGLTTMGDYSFTIWGFLATLLGVGLASTKTVTANRLMTGSLALTPLELLARMSPLAAIQCLFYAMVNGELENLKVIAAGGHMSTTLLIAVLGNASTAFLLNCVSFQTNKLAGALTISICGNLKQCLTIALGIVMFHLELAPLNYIGIVIAAGGAAWYSSVELRSRAQLRP